MLSRFRLVWKFIAVVAIAMLSISLVGWIGLSKLYDKSFEDRQTKLREVTQVAEHVVRHYHALAKDGKLSEAEAKDQAKATLRGLRYGQGEYFFVYDEKGTSLVLGPSPAVEGQNRIDLKDSDGVLFVRELIRAAPQGGFVGYRYPRAGSDQPVRKLSTSTAFAPWGWVIGTGVYVDDIDTMFRTELTRIGTLIAIILLIVGGLSWILARSVTLPIGQIVAAMKRLAGGDLKMTLKFGRRSDEVGELSDAYEVFRSNMAEAERLRADQEQMKERAAIDKRAAMNKMADDFEHGVKGFVQMIASASTELESTAKTMSVTAEQTQRQSGVVSAASDRASSNVQTVAAAAEELSASITEISRQVNESTRITGQAVKETEQTNVEIKTLAEAAQRIGDVVKLINDIAGQTNLLALNATIEAARAGEAGKGFAVVASEVKSLATQTARATEEISAKITEIQSATGNSVEAVRVIGQTIGRINEITTSIAAAVEEQGAATQEIARNVQEASTGTSDVSSNIAGVTQAAGETGAAAGQVLEASGELAKQSEALRGRVDSFVAHIRSA